MRIGWQGTGTLYHSGLWTLSRAANVEGFPRWNLYRLDSCIAHFPSKEAAMVWAEAQYA